MSAFEGLETPVEVPHTFQQPKRMMPAPEDLLQTIIVCLLKDRAGANHELQDAYIKLIDERHQHFHTNRIKKGIDWRVCGNPICQGAVKLLEQLSSTTDYYAGFLELQAAQFKRVLMAPQPGRVHVYVEDKPKVEVPRIIRP